MTKNNNSKVQPYQLEDKLTVPIETELKFTIQRIANTLQKNKLTECGKFSNRITAATLCRVMLSILARAESSLTNVQIESNEEDLESVLLEKIRKLK